MSQRPLPEIRFEIRIGFAPGKEGAKGFSRDDAAT
jgi:hypothetical protein